MLKPDTEGVWQFLRRQPGLTGFVLMGGSALALRLGHRQSKDLDFVWPGPELPRDRLEVMTWFGPPDTVAIPIKEPKVSYAPGGFPD